MDKWWKILLGSVAAFFVLGGLGMYGILSLEGEVVARGDASKPLTFDSNWDNYYDIYAEDEDIEITFETSNTHDKDFTYLLRCGEGNDGEIGITGDCMDKRQGAYLVADLSVEGSDIGDVTLFFNGTGEVIVVESGLFEVVSWIGITCFGCCLSPLIAIFAGIKLAKGNPQGVVILDNQMIYPQPQYQPIINQPEIITVDTNQVMGSGVVNANTPPSHVTGGYEWLNQNDTMYFREVGSNSEWKEFQG